MHDPWHVYNVDLSGAQTGNNTNATVAPAAITNATNATGTGNSSLMTGRELFSESAGSRTATEYVFVMVLMGMILKFFVALPLLKAVSQLIDETAPSEEGGVDEEGGGRSPDDLKLEFAGGNNLNQDLGPAGGDSYSSPPKQQQSSNFAEKDEQGAFSSSQHNSPAQPNSFVSPQHSSQQNSPHHNSFVSSQQNSQQNSPAQQNSFVSSEPEPLVAVQVSPSAPPQNDQQDVF